MRCISDFLIVLCGCLCVFSLVLFGLIYLFQAPIGEMYSPELAKLQTDIWHYLLASDADLLIGHAKLDMNEERHLLDVKRLFKSFFYVIGMLSAVFAIGLYRTSQCWWQMVTGVGRLGLCLIAVLVMLVIVAGFRTGFVWFHALLFAENTWWFDVDSSLIQIFPAVYFQQLLTAFLIVSTVIFIVLYWFAARFGSKA